MDRRFQEAIYQTPPHLRDLIHGCQNGIPNQIKWTYLPGRCVSYCFATYIHNGLNKRSITVNLCNVINEGCCSYSREYCWNELTQSPKIVEGITADNIICEYYKPEI